MSPDIASAVATMEEAREIEMLNGMSEDEDDDEDEDFDPDARLLEVCLEGDVEDLVGLMEDMARAGEALTRDMLNYADQSGRVSGSLRKQEGSRASNLIWVWRRESVRVVGPPSNSGHVHLRTGLPQQPMLTTSLFTTNRCT